ncbi:MAG TPA: molybdopterin-dependent oxidoreductase [Granulicella sp.]|nr:molybdopterin-dependent oxidoreductase [Granulicella sp.]
MSDGREEREEQEKRREWERERRRPDEDRIPDEDDWVPERYDSKAAEGPVPTGDAAGVSGPGPPEAAAAADGVVLAESRRRTRRSFVVAAAAAAAGYGVYRWIDRSPLLGRQQMPLRRGFETNAAVARGGFGERGVAPTYPVAKAVELRFNGPYGLRQELMLETWRLKLVGVDAPQRFPQYVPDVTAWNYVEKPNMTMSKGKSGQADESKRPAETPGMWMRGVKADGSPRRGQEEAGESASGLAGATPGLLLTLDDVKRLPHHELVTEFKCIEGWSEVVCWGGVRFADLIAAYPPVRSARYVYMETPFGDYYCGYDLNACTHPQSLLATEMSGAPLTQAHGAPLRLHMPIKYGYKQIKRIALIAFTDKRPDDYWTKLGYDWYAGL